MEAIVIEIKNEADSKFWLKLAKKTGARAKSINTEDLEDSNLASLIEKGMKTKSVSRESVMESLGQKMKTEFKTTFLKAIKKIEDNQLKSSIANTIRNVESAGNLKQIRNLK